MKKYEYCDIKLSGTWTENFYYRASEVDACIAELEAENEELKKQIETINALAGEPMPDIITRTST